MSENEKIVDVLKSIAKSKIKILNFFSEFEKRKRLQRWENWLQLEMLYELERSGVDDLWFEDRYAQDRRVTVPKEKTGNKISSIDLVYRRSNYLKGLYVGIELKVKDAPYNAIRGSLVDLLRLGAVTPAEWGFRAIYAVSIFKKENCKKSKYIDLVNTFSDGGVLNFGPYRVAVFGWEAQTLENATRESYRDWLNKLKLACVDRNISLHE
jgi:hypothetical protein